jgi:hypothetical protein
MYYDKYLTTGALMDRSTYMDNFAASATHDKDIFTIFVEVTSPMNTIHLPMYKWATNLLTCRTFADTGVIFTDRGASSRHGLGHPV